MKATATARKKAEKQILSLVHDHFGPKGQAERAKAAAAADLEREKQRQRDIRSAALGDLKKALATLALARDTVTAIAEDVEGASYFESGDLGRIAEMLICDAGTEVEQALCNLGLIEECDHGWFVDDKLVRAGKPAEV